MNALLKIIAVVSLSICVQLVYAANDTPVGTVIFSIGNSSTSIDNQAAAPISKGQTIHIGQLIKTEQNGHVHIRFNDNAFVSVRPNSVLVIEDYLVDSKIGRAHV